MKSSLPAASLTVVSLTALAAILAGCTAPASDTVVVTRDRFLDLPIELLPPNDPSASFTLYVGLGDSREHVLTSCGRPEMAISPDLWAYGNCYSTAKAARQGDCDTMLILFAADRVVGMKLVNRNVLAAALTERLRPRQPGS